MLIRKYLMTSAHDHLAEGKIPVLFIGHGSPMNMVLDNRFSRALRTWCIVSPAGSNPCDLGPLAD
jgi:hypothetical protein